MLRAVAAIVVALAMISPAAASAFERVSNLYFAFDSTEVHPRADLILPGASRNHKTLAAWLPEGEALIIVAGHAASGELDQCGLARRRAVAMHDRLLQLDVPAEQMIVLAFGAQRPALPGPDGYFGPQNRRVELILVNRRDAARAADWPIDTAGSGVMATGDCP